MNFKKKTKWKQCDQAKRLETFAQHTQSYTKHTNKQKTKQTETYETQHDSQSKQFLHCFFVACFSP